MTYSADTPWLGQGQATGQQVYDWFKSHNPDIGNLADAIVSSLVKWCATAGLNMDLVAAQISEETGWWTSDWALNHNNPAGIGVTGEPGVGLSFPTIEAGIHAQCAHLLSYVVGDGNPLKADDPRWQYMDPKTRGTHQTLGSFGAGIWAADPDYASKLVSHANSLLAFIGSQGGSTVAGDDPKNSVFKQSSNYDQGRSGKTVEKVVIHTTEGGFDGAWGWLLGAASGSGNDGSSTHYLIRADGSEQRQMVRESDTAWTVGNYDWNCRTISIEQEGYADKGGFVDGLYKATGELVGRICARHGLPVDRDHVIGHYEIPSGQSGTAVPVAGDPQGGTDHHYDPGQYYDWDRMMAYARGEAPQGAAQTAQAAPESRYFPETGHTLSHGFLRFWESYGDRAVATLGFPISEEFSDNGVTVQYTERARLEWHPGVDPDHFDVQLGLLGDESVDAAKSAHPDAFQPVPQP